MISGSIGLRTSAACLIRCSCCAAGVSFAEPFGNHSRFQVVHLTVCELLYPAIKTTERAMTAANVLGWVILAVDIILSLPCGEQSGRIPSRKVLGNDA